MRIRRQSLFVTMFVAASAAMMQAQQQPLLTGQAAFTDWNQQKPGVRHKITVADLPAPNDAEAVSNSPRLIPKPANAWPTAPPGFKVTVYVGNATTVQRLPYKVGDLKASGSAETIVPDIPGYAQLTGGGHWTRDVVFTKDGKHMLVSVGSGSNVDDPDTHPREFHRADVLEYTPEGKFVEVYASGIRNCVGEAVNPATGELWCSVNERDN